MSRSAQWWCPPQCFVAERTWLSVGWNLLRSKADYSRDCLLPAPSAGYSGCVRRALRYDAASAVQTKILQTLRVSGELVFQHRVARYWTPYSPRNFLPSAAAALNVPKADKDMLGWAAEESERYARVSLYRIVSIQQQVARTFTNAESGDPLSEQEALEDFATFLRREGGAEADCNRYLALFSSRAFAKQKREEEVLESVPEEHHDVEVVQDEEDVLVPSGPTRIEVWNANRSAAFGDKPKEARKLLRSSMEPWFYLATSTFRNLKILHRLGSCYFIPGVDYL